MQSDGVVAVAVSHVITDAVYFAILNIISALTCAWCFDAVAWVAGMAFGLCKIEWWGAGVVICLERGADLRCRPS